MATLTWQEPPGESHGRRGVFAEEAAELRKHPGRSAVIKQFSPEQAGRARTVSNDIRTGRYVAFRPVGAFGSSTATEVEHNDQGQPVAVVNVYAWYEGEDED